jgi:PAS domain S-box-containing protein
MESRRRIVRVGNMVLLVAILAALYLSSLYSYLLFHSLAELFGVVVATGIFIVAWNSRRILQNNYLLFLGIAYLFIGCLDLVHTLAYSGMGVFPGYETNLPTQVWISARYLESISLLMAPLFIGRRLSPAPALGLYAAATAALLVLIFTGVFPDCFVEGKGLTPFKKTSEHIISFILLGSISLLYTRRAVFDPGIFRLLAASITLTIGSELAFTFYVHAYGFFNLVGHYLKIISFVLIYRALIETGLTRPYDLLFRDLKRSEEKYRALFASMLTGFAYHEILLDKNGKPVDYVFLEVNDAFERMTGLRKSEITGKRVTEALPGIRDDPADWIGLYGRVALTGGEARFEQYSRPLDRWYDVSAYSPEKGYFVTLFDDITERKQAEALLKLNESRLEALHELSHMTDVSVDDMAAFVLEQAVRLTGSKLAFLGAMADGEKTVRIHAWSKQAMRECSVIDKPIHFPIEKAGIWAEAIRQRRPIIVSDFSRPNEMMRGLPEEHVELRNLLSVPVFDGESIVAVAAVGNKDGEYDASDINQLGLLMTGMWQYVRRRRTEEELAGHRERLEELVEERTAELMRTNDDLQREIAGHGEALDALGESETRFENLIESAPVGISISTPEGRVIEANSYLVKMLEYGSKGELLKLPASAHYAESRDRERFLEALKSGKARDLEVQLKRKSGEVFWASVTSVAQATASGVFFINSLQDISERKRLEEEMLRAQKLESLGVLAGGIAHDFNNALTAILNNIAVARMSAVHDRTRKLLSAAENASLMARNLTRQLLTFAKGGGPVRKLLHLPDVVKEAASFSLAGSNVRCDFRMAPDLWPAHVDEGQITQVISNLVINAHQAMPDGGTITVSAENAVFAPEAPPPASEGNYIKLTVSDQGAGVPEEHASRIFDPYYTTKEQGSGLGLATAYSIIRKHGGWIVVESRPGEGASFCFYLPAAPGEAVDDAGKEPPSPGRAARILLLEDDAMIAESLAMALEESGFRAKAATDGADIVRMYREAFEAGRPFAAVVMDLTVPEGMGGREALEVLRGIDPGVRAIATSGYANNPVMTDYGEHGFLGALEKPYRIEDLLDMLKSIGL